MKAITYMISHFLDIIKTLFATFLVIYKMRTTCIFIKYNTDISFQLYGNCFNFINI